MTAGSPPPMPPIPPPMPPPMSPPMPPMSPPPMSMPPIGAASAASPKVGSGSDSPKVGSGSDSPKVGSGSDAPMSAPKPMSSPPSAVGAGVSNSSMGCLTVSATRGRRCVSTGRAICGEGAWGRSGVQTSRQWWELSAYSSAACADTWSQGAELQLVLCKLLCASLTQAPAVTTRPRRRVGGDTAPRRSSAPLLGSQGATLGGQRRRVPQRGQWVHRCSGSVSKGRNKGNKSEFSAASFS